MRGSRPLQCDRDHVRWRHTVQVSHVDIKVFLAYDVDVSRVSVVERAGREGGRAYNVSECPR